MSDNRNITQLPVNTNLSTIEGFAAVDISGANVQISGQSIIDSIDAVTSVLSSNTALLTVTGGNVPTITVNTAPIAKGGTGLATADQIVTYVATQTGGTQDLQSVMDQGSTATGLSTLVQISTSNQLDFTSTDGVSNFAYLRTVNNNDLTLSAGNGSLGGEISLNSTLSYFKYNNASGDQQVDFNGTAMTVTDAINTKGLEYAAAYKDEFTIHSLVDKDYVDTQIAGIPGGAQDLQSVMDQGSSATAVATDVTIERTGANNTEMFISNEYGYFKQDDGTWTAITGNDAATYSSVDVTNGTLRSSVYASRTDTVMQYITSPTASKSIVLDASAMTVTDTTATPKGLEYAGSYKDNFTTYSLVDKDYVDTQIAGIPGGAQDLQSVMGEGSTATVTTPINITLNNVTYDHQIDFSTNNLLMETTDGTEISHFKHVGSTIGEMKTVDGTGGEARVRTNSDGKVGIKALSGSGDNEIKVNPTTIEIVSSLSRGMKYDGDYSINGISTYGNRWIPDVGWVNTQIAAIPSGGSTIGSVGEIPFSNAAGTDFDYVSNIKTNGSQTYIGYSATFATTANTLTVNNATGNNEVMMVRDRAGGDARLMTLTSEGGALGEGKEGLISKIYALGNNASHSRGLWSQAATVNVTGLNNQNFYGGRFTGVFDDDDGYGLIAESIGTNPLHENIGLKIIAENGQTNTGIQIVDGSEGTIGHVLTSTDVNGRGRWQAPPSGASGSFTSADGKTITVTNGLITSIV